MTRNFTLTGLILIAALLVYQLSSSDIPLLDSHADRYFAETTAEAALAYATVRGVNGVISVLKESQIEFSPAGVGFSIAAGQILDPIDDMTERLSVVVVTALVSLGLQKLAMEISGALPLKCLALVLSIAAVSLWLKPAARRAVLTPIVRLALFLLIIRLLLPLSSLLSDSLYRHVLQDEIAVAEKELSSISTFYRELSTIDADSEAGLVASLSQSARKKVDSFRQLFARVADNVDTIINALLQLTILYVCLFILQVIVIPVSMLWLLVLLVNRLFAWPVLQPPRSLPREQAA